MLWRRLQGHAVLAPPQFKQHQTEQALLIFAPLVEAVDHFAHGFFIEQRCRVEQDLVLNIRGSVQRESKEQRKDYFRCEIAQGNFSRSLSMPSGIDTAKISATVKDGILEITLPKEEGAQRRTVEVK